jgi:hypothetical protein
MRLCEMRYGVSSIQVHPQVHFALTAAGKRLSGVDRVPNPQFPNH